MVPEDTATSSAAGVGSVSRAPQQDWNAQASLLSDLMATISGMRPDMKSFVNKDPTTGAMVNADGLTYTEALGEWMGMLTEVADVSTALQDMNSGFYTLPDGTAVPLTSLPPEQLAAVQAANSNLFAKLMNDYQVSSYDLQNDRATQSFNDKVAQLQSSIGVDNVTQRQAEQKISRHIQGLQEARGRAEYITNTQMAAAPYATSGGKTSFSANDVGGMASAWASRMGLDPGASLLNYTGTVNIDPEGQLANQGSLLGLVGGIPDLPELNTNASMVPGLPDRPAIPSLTPPTNTGSLVSMAAAGRSPVTPQMTPVTPLAVPPTPSAQFIRNPAKAAATLAAQRFTARKGTQWQPLGLALRSLVSGVPTKEK